MKICCLPLPWLDVFYDFFSYFPVSLFCAFLLPDSGIPGQEQPLLSKDTWDGAVVRLIALRRGSTLLSQCDNLSSFMPFCQYEQHVHAMMQYCH